MHKGGGIMSSALRFALMLLALSLCAAPAMAQEKKVDKKAQPAKKAAKKPEPKKAEAKKADIVDKSGAPAACKQMADVCRKDGYLPADWKDYDGLWSDCVDPILQGQTIVAGAKRPLPSIDPKVVAACKASHPKYGAKPAAKKK